jgi:hypothetical protein
MMEESQQITAYPWQERLPFKHLPKVETLPVDFSIKSIALIGGTEAVKFMGIAVHSLEDDEPARPSYSQTSPHTEQSNLVLPQDVPPSMEEFGFSYEEVDAPQEVNLTEPEIDETVKYAFHVEDEPV